MILNENLFDDSQYNDNAFLLRAPIMNINKNATSQEDNGVASLINMAIQDTLTSIEQFNSCLISLPSGYEEVANIFQAIVADENKHVGQLQVALEMVDPQAKLRMQGEAEALLDINKNSN